MLTRCLPEGHQLKTKLTPAAIARAKAAPGADRTIYWDASLPGFGVMVTAAGHKSYVCQYRAGRRSRRMTIDGVLGLQEARREARSVLGIVAKGGDPLSQRRREAEQSTNTFRSLAELYLKREAKRLRTVDQRRSTFERLLFPKFGTRQIDDIRKSEIVKHLEKIEEERGPVMAARTFEAIRRLMIWHAGRSDEFRSPISRGTWESDRTSRERILTAEELRAVWTAADATPGPFGALVQLILLTATRRNEAARMSRDELAGDEWTIPKARYKAKPGKEREHLVPLTRAALAVLAKLPLMDGCPFVFSTDGRHPISGFSGMKTRFDKLCGVTGWTLHDLRRTARTLMSQAKVPPDHAERAIGHEMGGVRGIYDKHAFKEEKRQAFEALARLIDQIVQHPRSLKIAL